MLDRDGDLRADGVRLTYSVPVRRPAQPRPQASTTPFLVARRKITGIGRAQGRSIVIRLAELTSTDVGKRPSLTYFARRGTPVRSLAGVAALGQRILPVALPPRAVPTPAPTSTVTTPPAAMTPAPAPTSCPTSIRLLSLSDWRGALDPVQVAPDPSTGGAAVIDAYWDAERAGNPNTIAVAAGQSFGGGAPLSEMFADAPTIAAMNMMGFTADALGNRNFMYGLPKLQANINGASFGFTAANLNTAGALSGTSQYRMVRVGGVDVAFIGITNHTAPSLTPAGSFGAITISDPVSSANAARLAARNAGADLVVGLVQYGATGVDGVGQPVGPLVDFAVAVSGFDVIVGAHSERTVSASVGGALVLQTLPRGRQYGRVDIPADPCAGTVGTPTAAIVAPVASAVTPDAAVAAALAPYRPQLTTAFDGVVAVTNGTFTRSTLIGGERTHETALGNLVADSIRARYGTQLAVIEGGSLRFPLPSNYVPQNGALRRPDDGAAPWDLVVGDIYTVLPFGNELITRTVTGAQLWDVMEQSLVSAGSTPTPNSGFLQISGFKVAYTASNPPGARVTSIALTNNTPIPDDATPYTITVPDFLNKGGGGHSALAVGGGVGESREDVAIALREYLEAQPGALTPATDGRIARTE